jgi:hypothetical protein
MIGFIQERIMSLAMSFILAHTRWEIMTIQAWAAKEKRF